MEAYLKNKVVLVTGGTDGIGKSLVQKLLLAGAQVATCGRNLEKLNQLQLQHNSSPLFTTVADISQENDCAQLIEQTVKKFGTIDILINNAGISMRAELINTSVDVYKKVMDINFFGALYCTKMALPFILKNKGTIVGVSSIAGYRGLPGRGGYSASKHALQGWLESLRTELLDSGVNVMWVCPGFTTSNIRNAALDSTGNPFGETPMDEGAMMSADECALRILNSIEKRKRTLVMTFTGMRTVFMNKFFPNKTDRMVRNFFYKNGNLIK